MTQLGCAIAFTLGVAFAIRGIAALCGIVDFWFAIRTWYPRVLRGIVGWCGGALLVAALLERPYRTAFGLGLLAFALWYVSLFGLRHLVVRPIAPAERAGRPAAEGR